MTQADREAARAARKQAVLDSPERAWVLENSKQLKRAGTKYFTIAECLFVHGMSVQATAERLGITFDQVRPYKWRLLGMMDWCGAEPTACPVCAARGAKLPTQTGATA